MYDIALTVASCLRSGTRADVAWILDSHGLPVGDRSAAVVFTPGGGKIGDLVGGALDGALRDLAGRANRGRVIDVEVSEVEAMIAELPSAGSARCLLAPADSMPAVIWDLARMRVPFCLDLRLDDDEVTSIEVFSEVDIAQADELVKDLFATGTASSVLAEDRVVSAFSAVPKAVVVGSGPVAEAVVQLASIVGWDARLEQSASAATGLIAPLSQRDMVVVAAHDIELAGAALKAAIESDSGYIGSIGSRRMQSDRGDWLAYRGVSDLSRINGPAGLDIGADTPMEIAISVLAEAIGFRSGSGAKAVDG